MLQKGMMAKELHTINREKELDMAMGMGMDDGTEDEPHEDDGAEDEEETSDDPTNDKSAEEE